MFSFTFTSYYDVIVPSYLPNMSVSSKKLILKCIYLSPKPKKKKTQNAGDYEAGLAPCCPVERWCPYKGVTSSCLTYYIYII